MFRDKYSIYKKFESWRIIDYKEPYRSSSGNRQQLHSDISSIKRDLS